jgi:hypothetical protein
MKEEAIKLLKLAEEICVEQHLGVDGTRRDLHTIVAVAQLLATLKAK